LLARALAPGRAPSGGALVLRPLVQSQRLALANAAERIEARGVAAVVRRREDAGAGGRAAGIADAPGLGPRRRSCQRDERDQCSRPKHLSHRHFSPPSFLHTTPALDKTPAGVMKQNNSNVRMKDMDKFTTLEGVAAPLKMINVDTDMIIPKQYLKTIKRTGLGTGLFAEKRYRDDGSENPDFVLNKPAYRKAKILVTEDNFGCGSSREHAPWALMDFGIRCVISTSFGDIFYNNCFKNGVLPIKVSREDLDKLFDDAERGANATLSIDLEKQEIRGPDGGVIRFEIDAHRKHCLLNGLDDIGLTMVKKDKIERFEQQSKAARPWS
jgi:3-isopropylmalate/(R)-2-methylmalate dehydratase small subunit